MQRYVGMDVRSDRVVMFNNRGQLTTFVTSEPFFRVGFTCPKDALKERIAEHRMKLAMRFMEA